jgi:hypothetical protein
MKEFYYRVILIYLCIPISRFEILFSFAVCATGYNSTQSRPVAILIDQRTLYVSLQFRRCHCCVSQHGEIFQRLGFLPVIGQDPEFQRHRQILSGSNHPC